MEEFLIDLLHRIFEDQMAIPWVTRRISPDMRRDSKEKHTLAGISKSLRSIELTHPSYVSKLAMSMTALRFETWQEGSHESRKATAASAALLSLCKHCERQEDKEGIVNLMDLASELLNLGAFPDQYETLVPNDYYHVYDDDQYHDEEAISLFSPICCSVRNSHVMLTKFLLGRVRNSRTRGWTFHAAREAIDNRLELILHNIIEWSADKGENFKDELLPEIYGYVISGRKCSDLDRAKILKGLVEKWGWPLHDSPMLFIYHYWQGPLKYPLEAQEPDGISNKSFIALASESGSEHCLKVIADLWPKSWQRGTWTQQALHEAIKQQSFEAIADQMQKIRDTYVNAKEPNASMIKILQSLYNQPAPAIVAPAAL